MIFPIPFVVAKRLSDRIRRTYPMCTAEKVQRVQAGEDIGDPFMTVAIERELEEYGFKAKQL